MLAVMIANYKSAIITAKKYENKRAFVMENKIAPELPEKARMSKKTIHAIESLLDFAKEVCEKTHNLRFI